MSATCPNCGAALEAGGAAQVVVCAYCGAYSLVTEGSLALAGNVAPLADLPSSLEVGVTGKLLGRPFTALGRVRYDYDDGLWDEWSLYFEDGQLGWLQEDEGELTFFDRREQGPDPSESGLDLDVGVGSLVDAFGRKVFATEVGEASLVGGQGQITSHLAPGQRFAYVDGTADGDQAIVMAAPGVSVLFLGKALSPSDLET
jgi:hypothetical protein